MKKKSSKIKSIVTGAGGFIGANLIRKLAERGDIVLAAVHSLKRNWRLKNLPKGIILREIDITNKKQVNKIFHDFKPDYVFHLAQYGGNKKEKDENLVRKVIIEGTANVYNACLENKNCKKIINLGSSSEYGIQKFSMSEKMIVEPNSPYAAAKVWTTLYGQYLAKEKKLPVVTLRPFSAYGPYEAGDRLIPTVIFSGLKGRKIKLGDPKTVRDFVFIDDVIKAILLAAKIALPGDIINVGTGKQTTLEEVVKKILKILGKETPVLIGAFRGRRFDARFWRADTKHCENVLKWKPRHNIESGLKKTIDWFKKNINLYSFS